MSNSPCMQKLPREHQYVIEKLIENKSLIYTAGHTSRALFSDKVPKKIELVTTAGLQVLVELFKYVDIRRHEDGSRILSVLVEQEIVELTLVDSIFMDADKRAFALDAIYLNPMSQNHYDPKKGFERGIRMRRIETIGDPQARLIEEPIRMLKAVNLRAETGFEIDTQLVSAITERSSVIARLPANEVRNHIVELLLSDNPEVGLETMLTLGLLKYILPEVATLAKCKQQSATGKEEDLWTNTMSVIKTLKKVDCGVPLLLAAMYYHTGRNNGDRKLERVESLSMAFANKEMSHLKFLDTATLRVLNILRNIHKAHTAHLLEPEDLQRWISHMFNNRVFADVVTLQHAIAENSDGDIKSNRSLFIEAAKQRREKEGEQVLIENQVKQLPVLVAPKEEAKEEPKAPEPPPEPKRSSLFGLITEAIKEAHEEGLFATAGTEGE